MQIRLRTRCVVGVALSAIVAIGFVLRVYQIGESLWIDELHTAWVASGPLPEVVPRARLGNQSPLYFLLAWLSAHWLGMSEVALRLPTLLVGTALIGLAYAAAFAWTGSRAIALMGAALAAVDRNFIFYSLEARPYALVALGGLLHVLAFQRVLRRPTPVSRTAWVLGAALLFYLHYTSALLIAAELAFYPIARRRFPRRCAYSAGSLCLDLCAIAALCSPASGHLLEIAWRADNWRLFVRQPAWTTLLLVFPVSAYVAFPAAIVAVVAGMRWARRLRPWLRNTDADLVMLAICWLVVPVTIAWITTQTDLARLFIRRYLMVSSAAPIMLCTLICNLCPTSQGRITSALLVICLAVVTAGPYLQIQDDVRVVRHSEEDWRSAVATLNAELDDHSLPVFVRSGLIEADALRGSPSEVRQWGEYCLLPVRGIYMLENERREVIPLPTTDSGHVSKRHWQRMIHAGGAWFLIRGDRARVDHFLNQLRFSANVHAVELRIADRRSFGRIGLVRVIAELSSR